MLEEIIIESCLSSFILKDDNTADFNSSENDEDIDLPGKFCCFIYIVSSKSFLITAM